MISRIDLRGRTLDAAVLRRTLPRAEFDVQAAMDVVRPICEQVRDGGVSALRDLTRRFDGVALTDLRVPASALSAALEQLDPQVHAALEESIRRVRLAHRDQRRTDTRTQVSPGGMVTQRWIPVGRVGLYTPGGVAPLASSVVMNAVPAQEAGVPSIALASPPQKDNPPQFAGLPHPTVLAACAMLGIDEVYAAGGAQAIAMFAYGVADDDHPERFVCPPVDLVSGPGNIYVVAAKRLLKGIIGIDSEAGPSEILVLADDTADPAHVAADLISQAEHGPLSASLLVTAHPELADAVQAELERQCATTKHAERVREALTGSQSAIVLVDDLDAALLVCDAYGAEHLEVQTRQAAQVAARVRNAGAIFVGAYAPVSLGDYCAGSNHVLPTGGCACHSGGLSVQSFLRGVHVVEYDQAALSEVARHVMTLAEAEDLPAHGDAVRVRFADPA